MSFADTIKGLIFKKKPDRRQSPQSSEAGPRSSGLENPYLSAPGMNMLARSSRRARPGKWWASSRC